MNVHDINDPHYHFFCSMWLYFEGHVLTIVMRSHILLRVYRISFKVEKIREEGNVVPF